MAQFGRRIGSFLPALTSLRHYSSGFEKDAEAKNKQADAAGFHQKKKEADSGADAGYKKNEEAEETDFQKNKATWLAREQKKREQEVNNILNQFKAVRRGQTKQLSLQKQLYKDLNLGIKHQKFRDLSLPNKVHKIKGTASYGFLVIVYVIYVYWKWLNFDKPAKAAKQILIDKIDKMKNLALVGAEKTPWDPLKKD